MFYFVGEYGLADDTLLVNLVMEGVELDAAERDLIRAVVEDLDAPELAGLRVVDEPATVTPEFLRTAPRDAPDPSRADEVLAAEAARHGVRDLRRTWRASGPATWLYVAVVDEGADELRVHAALSSRLGAELGLAWPVEITTPYGEPHSYQRRAHDNCHGWRGALPS